MSCGLLDVRVGVWNVVQVAGMLGTW